MVYVNKEFVVDWGVFDWSSAKSIVNSLIPTYSMWTFLNVFVLLFGRPATSLSVRLSSLSENLKIIVSNYIHKPGNVKGGLAQLVERTVRIGEARGSKPRTSNFCLFSFSNEICDILECNSKL